MSSEFSMERGPAQTLGKETAEGLIAQAEESLEKGFFDKKERDESKRMLRTAQLLSQDAEIKKRVDRLLADIENLYGEA